MRADFIAYIFAISRHWRPLATGVGALLVTALVERAWPDHAPWWVWVSIIITSVLIASFMAWRETKREKDEFQNKFEATIHELKGKIADLTTSKLSITFNPDDNSCIGPVDVQLGDAGGSTTFRRAFLIVTNETAIPITEMQVYCENISVTSEELPIVRKEDYRRVILGGSSHPIDLSPKEKRHVGIVREIVHLTSIEVVTEKWIELHIPLKCVSARVLYGREFLIDVIVHAKEEPAPRRASYVFGWRDDEFFFGERGSRSWPVSP
jgi:hypothetical protein